MSLITEATSVQWSLTKPEEEKLEMRVPHTISSQQRRGGYVCRSQSTID